MSVKHYTVKSIFLTSWINNIQQSSPQSTFSVTHRQRKRKFDLLSPLRQWLNNLEVNDRLMAHRLCKFIPTQCPFEREIKLFGLTIFKIPPMCKLNPLYNEVVSLRFRAICYLADICGEDVSSYC